MSSQPTNVRIVTNDREVRSGTTQSSEFLLRLSTVTLTSEDLDRLAVALGERFAGGIQSSKPAEQEDAYVTVRRNSEQRSTSEY